MSLSQNQRRKNIFSIISYTLAEFFPSTEDLLERMHLTCEDVKKEIIDKGGFNGCICMCGTCIHCNDEFDNMNNSIVIVQELNKKYHGFVQQIQDRFTENFLEIIHDKYHVNDKVKKIAQRVSDGLVHVLNRSDVMTMINNSDFVQSINVSGTLFKVARSKDISDMILNYAIEVNNDLSHDIDELTKIIKKNKKISTWLLVFIIIIAVFPIAIVIGSGSFHYLKGVIEGFKEPHNYDTYTLSSQSQSQSQKLKTD